MTNNSYLFYRKYFDINSVDDLKDLNTEIYNSKIIPINQIINYNEDIFFATTQYPGLLIGSGYGHDYKNSDQNLTNEGYKIGFFFDYSTGMPIIPGSSVKGVLRSYFPQRSVIKTSKRIDERFELTRTSFISEILKEKLKISAPINIDELEDELFHGKRDGKNIPLYKRDIFFDAVPIEIKNKNNHLLDSDYITAHYENLLKNPEPIKFLKVSSNVIYRFEFKLFDSVVCPQLTKDKKLDLFKLIIELLGIGAKTNVGYGQFQINKNIPRRTIGNEITFGSLRSGETVTGEILIGKKVKLNISGYTITHEVAKYGEHPIIGNKYLFKIVKKGTRIEKIEFVIPVNPLT